MIFHPSIHPCFWNSWFNFLKFEHLILIWTLLILVMFILNFSRLILSCIIAIPVLLILYLSILFLVLKLILNLILLILNRMVFRSSCGRLKPLYRNGHGDFFYPLKSSVFVNFPPARTLEPTESCSCQLKLPFTGCSWSFSAFRPKDGPLKSP